jgi:hypothetical protein
MRYMLLIYTDASAWEAMTPEEYEQVHSAYGSFTQRIIESGEHIAGDALQGIDTATTIRVRNGRPVSTDGPFAETKEVLGGFYMVDCKDLDRASELAGEIPDAGLGTGSVEVRPIRDLSDMPGMS